MRRRAAVILYAASAVALGAVAMFLSSSIFALAAAPLLVLAFYLRATVIPIAFLAASTLLPLIEIDKRPADNYVVAATLLITPVAVIALSQVERATTVQWGLLILTGAVALSTTLGPPGGTYHSVARFLTYVGFVAVVTRLPTPRHRLAVGSLVVGCLLAASVLASRLGFGGIPAYTDLESAELRYGGLVGHPNFAAYVLSLCLIFLIAAPSWNKMARYPLLVMFGSALLITGSRGAVVALAAALLLILPHWWRRVIAIAAVAYVLLTLLGVGLVDRFFSLLNSGGVTGENSSGWRLNQWERVMDLHDPFALTGVGWLRTQDFLASQLAAHNGYLQVWAELGLGGCVGLGVLIAGLIKLARGRGPVAWALLAFTLLANVGDPVLLYPATTYLLLGLTFALPHRDPKMPVGDDRDVELSGDPGLRLASLTRADGSMDQLRDWRDRMRFV